MLAYTCNPWVENQSGVGHDNTSPKSADSARCLPIVFLCKLSSLLSPTNYMLNPTFETDWYQNRKEIVIFARTSSNL